MFETITTTNGNPFTSEDHQALASLLFRRWGCDAPAFCIAWRRLFQNNADDATIMKLIPNPDRKFPSYDGRILTYFEAERFPCIGKSPCPACAVSEDDRSERSEYEDRDDGHEKD